MNNENQFIIIKTARMVVLSILQNIPSNRNCEKLKTSE